MNTLELNKKEVGYLFLIMALFPMFAFTAGLYLSGNSSSDSSNEPVMKSIAQTESINQESQPIYASTPSIIKDPADSLDDESIINTQLDDSEISEISYQYDVQAGVFSKISNAIKYQDHLMSKGINTEIIADRALADSFLYRIVLATYDSKSEAIEYIISTEQIQQLNLYIKETHNQIQETIASL